LTNATPLDVLNTTETAVLTEEQTTDGTIASSMYEPLKLKAIVELLARFEEEEKSR
jgi:hypothetical protein